ncbi:four helix bundle protein [Pseudidiomarina sediminum]|uniref:Four helix bundle protein n=1 Tax=Pseudidiomarina sediminum TaxID=431675 RepID=A0A432Z932_9GAMM|nr:four helix bundle protein [Pseudidiomarina sediminum]RUO74426.1 four helix bundle protein [Pseudidiomarina sediminum]
MYQDLKVYQSAMGLCVVVYRITTGFPRIERFGLVSQMRRAAVSVSSNVAEGAERHSLKEQLRFYYIARGSITELKTQLDLSQRLGYICQDSVNVTNETYKLLNGLIRSVNYRIKQQAEPVTSNQ